MSVMINSHKVSTTYEKRKAYDTRTRSRTQRLHTIIHPTSLSSDNIFPFPPSNTGTEIPELIIMIFRGRYSCCTGWCSGTTSSALLSAYLFPYKTCPQSSITSFLKYRSSSFSPKYNLYIFTLPADARLLARTWPSGNFARNHTSPTCKIVRLYEYSGTEGNGFVICILTLSHRVCKAPRDLVTHYIFENGLSLLLVLCGARARW